MREIINSDQSGFRYTHFGNRTLSHGGEKTTIATVANINSTTHSYTIQPLLTLDGRLLKPLLINFREPTTGQLGPIVLSRLPQLPNVYCTATKSGKLNQQKIKEFSTNCLSKALDNIRSSKCVLVVDSWSGHAKEELYQLVGKKVELSVLPKKLPILFRYYFKFLF